MDPSALSLSSDLHAQHGWGPASGAFGTSKSAIGSHRGGRLEVDYRDIIWKTTPRKLPLVSMCLICLKNVTVTILLSRILNSGEETIQTEGGKRGARGMPGKPEARESAIHDNLWIFRIHTCSHVFPRLAGFPRWEIKPFSRLCCYLQWFGVQITRARR